MIKGTAPAILLGLILAVPGGLLRSAEFSQESGGGETLTIVDFIDLAAKKDTVFETILIDELPLKYRKDLELPARDIVLGVKSQYDFILSQNREEPDAAVSLSKLFPYTGTELSALYRTRPSFGSTENSSDLTFTLSQPIAENAFGKVTRMRDKIIGMEIDVARHQIIEAYEDFLATIIINYYNWYEAYENLLIGESSYSENLKLLDNIHDRKTSKIALPIDVNKVNLQVLAKKERLIELRQRYRDALNVILESIRARNRTDLVPAEPKLYGNVRANFSEDYPRFRKESRTYEILRLLEDKSELEVDKNAHELLPSLDLLMSYSATGDDHGIEDKDDLFFAGLSLEWPLSDQVQEAEHETARIALDRTRLNTQNTHYRLYTSIRNLSNRIDRESQLRKTTEEKLGLARSVLRDETENYSFGKVTLNDYIISVNVLDNNRFNKVLHDVQYRKLVVDFLRLTDRLISRSEIEKLR